MFFLRWDAKSLLEVVGKDYRVATQLFNRHSAPGAPQSGQCEGAARRPYDRLASGRLTSRFCGLMRNAPAGVMAIAR